MYHEVHCPLNVAICIHFDLNSLHLTIQFIQLVQRIVNEVYTKAAKEGLIWMKESCYLDTQKTQYPSL